MNDIKWWNEDEQLTVDNICDGCNHCIAKDGYCKCCGGERLYISAGQVKTDDGVIFYLECRDCGWSC